MTQQVESEPTGVDSRWWRDAVIYQIYLRSFADGDGDGVGDLLGVRSRLRYLSWLGVDALWLTPFYPSPMADGGYDVADHRSVDPGFGTLGDAEYDAKYRGLDHLFFDRAWLHDTLMAHGAKSVRIEDQHVRGYQNARFRFNAIAML